MGRYDYNRIFISDEEQDIIRNCRVFIGGAASGSVIHKAMPKMWLDQLLWDTRNTREYHLPEMSIAAYIAGGVCSNLLYKIACGKFVKFFPNFYFYSAKDDMN